MNKESLLVETPIIDKEEACPEVVDFVEELEERLYDHLPVNFQYKLMDKVEKLVLGTLPPYFEDDVGAYIGDEKKIYLGGGLLSSQNPEVIAEILFHEHGHPLLNDIFDELGVDDQNSADFLTLYSMDQMSFTNRALKDWGKYKDKVIDILGPNEEFIRKNLQLINNTKERWYKELEEKYAGELKPLELDEHVREVMVQLWPKIEDIIVASRDEANPVRKAYLLEALSSIAHELTVPIKGLSGAALDMPEEMAEQIERKCDVFLGCGRICTPDNNIEESVIELLDTNSKRELKSTLGWTNVRD